MKLFFQQDGHPAHSTLMVRQWLHEQFQNQWIGRYGPLVWPARSPDLTIMDFYLWGYLKQKVYERPLNNDLDELKTRIREAIANTPLQEIQKSYREFRYRVELCAEVGGETFE